MWIGWIAALVACKGTDSTPEDSATPDSQEQDGPGSAGCGLAPAHATGGVNVELELGAEGGGTRRFHLVIPEGYDPETPARLVVGYAGTNWVGEQIRPYLDLESGRADEIFAYPDPLWRDFEGWGNLGGWVLGPNAAPADGMEDLVFTAAMLDFLEESYCIDTERVFATGHSWGGDMAQVVSCFQGERFRASVPVAANRPYWFQESQGWSQCSGQTAVWTYFGVADDHFTWQDYPGQYGDECRDFWLDQRDCDGSDATQDLDIGAQGECVEFDGCSATTRYCRYGPESGHQIPSYYSQQTMDWFRSF